MADSDLKKFKDFLKGITKVISGISDPFLAVDKIYEETLTFELSADASLAEIGMRMKDAGYVVSSYFTPSTALAANGSSYVTYTLQKRDGAGGAAVSVGTTDTNTAGANVSLAAFTPSAMTITTTDADRKFAAGNVLTFKSAETGTPTSPIGILTVRVRYGVV